MLGREGRRLAPPAVCLVLLCLLYTPSTLGADPAPVGLSPPDFQSACGDPGQASKSPKVLLKGWNFCNRCGRACDVGPRWADCISAETGAQLVTAEDNSAGLPASQQSQPACDAFTAQKERSLGEACASPGDVNAFGEETFFWTLMLKSGATNSSEHGQLCGLWCNDKNPSCNAPDDDDTVDVAVPVSAGAAVATASRPASRPYWPPVNFSWTGDDYIMRQPTVVHNWSVPDGNGGHTGAFYGSYFPGIDRADIPTPDDVIARVSRYKECTHPEACSLNGTWWERGNSSISFNITQQHGPTFLSISCTFDPAPGLPKPWYNREANLTARDESSSYIDVRRDRHSYDYGVAVQVPPDVATGDNDTDVPSVICWQVGDYWCKGPCPQDVNMTQLCEPTWTPSYFSTQWLERDGRRIFRNVVQNGDDLNWIMLYVGPEAATGPRGGYPWDGRGQYAPVPVSTTYTDEEWPEDAGPKPSNTFRVQMWTNISVWGGGPGFYFLNYGACWKDDGTQCDGDLGTDVTRYLLFQVPRAGATMDDPDRCGPAPGQLDKCPKFHRYRNGTVVHAGSALFPYRAYHSVSRRAPKHLRHDGFKCKHDCFSNPCDQDWVRIEPSPEWAEYGFPANVTAALSPQFWDMEAGAVSAMVSSEFSGTTPPVMYWTTLNNGPEMQGPVGKATVWELAEYNVLIDKNNP